MEKERADEAIRKRYRQLLNLSGESMSLDTLNEDVVNYDFLNVLLLQKGSK